MRSILMFVLGVLVLSFSACATQRQAGHHQHTAGYGPSVSESEISPPELAKRSEIREEMRTMAKEFAADFLATLLLSLVEQELNRSSRVSREEHLRRSLIGSGLRTTVSSLERCADR